MLAATAITRKLQTTIVYIGMKYITLSGSAPKSCRMLLQIQLFLVQNRFAALSVITEKLFSFRMKYTYLLMVRQRQGVLLYRANDGLCLWYLEYFPNDKSVFGINRVCYFSGGRRHDTLLRLLQPKLWT